VLVIATIFCAFVALVIPHKPPAASTLAGAGSTSTVPATPPVLFAQDQLIICDSLLKLRQAASKPADAACVETVDLDDSDVTGPDLALIAQLPNVRTVKLQSRGKVFRDADYEFLSSLKQLESFSNFRSKGASFNVLRYIAAKDRMKVICIDNSREEDYAPINDAIYAGFSEFKNLETLEIARIDLDDAGCKEIAQIKTLKSLLLYRLASHKKVTEDGFLSLLDLPNLEEFYCLAFVVTKRIEPVLKKCKFKRLRVEFEKAANIDFRVIDTEKLERFDFVGEGYEAGVLEKMQWKNFDTLRYASITIINDDDAPASMWTIDPEFYVKFTNIDKLYFDFSGHKYDRANMLKLIKYMPKVVTLSAG
jgi:hypothetical protein